MTQGKKNLLDIYLDKLNFERIVTQPRTHKDIVVFFLSKLHDSLRNWYKFEGKKLEEIVRDQTELELYGILTPHVLKNHYHKVSETGQAEIRKWISDLFLYNKETQIEYDRLFRQSKRITKNILPTLDLAKGRTKLHHSFLSEENVAYFLREVRAGSVNFSFATLVINLKPFSRSQKGADSTKESKSNRYKIAKEIFEFLESKGETLPIKKDAIEGLIIPIWKKRSTVKPVKKDTLFDYQNQFLLEKKGKA